MTHWGISLALVVSIYCVSAYSQDIGANATVDARRRLIEQKLRLVESLVSSPAAQASVDRKDHDGSELVLTSRRLLSRARDSLKADQFDAAGTAIDEALRGVSKLSALTANRRGVLSTSVQETSFRNLLEQVRTYRASLDDLAKQGHSEAKAGVARINAFQEEATKLAEGGNLGEANRKLADAYKFAVDIISKLRAGQTVTLSLKFDTPAEEYEYERRRFQSSEILVDMMATEGRADGERRTMVDGFVRDGKQNVDMAADRARSGDYKGAVVLMENASKQLNRALQIMGVPIF